MELLEGYLLWNFAMDALIALAAARACGRERYMGCLCAAVFGAAYALAAEKWLPALKTWPGAALAGVLMAMIAVKPENANMALKAVGVLYAVSLFAAGAQMLFLQLLGSGTAGSLCAALAGTGMCIWQGHERRMQLETWDVMLFLRTKSGCVRFRALVDTGNRLHEPISGLPVMIVEEKALRRALPQGFSAADLSRIPSGWRMVRYGVLGSAGQMACFRPQRLLVSYGGRWLLAPDIWVAVYPGRIPGQVAALAPTVIGTIKPARHTMKMGTG